MKIIKPATAALLYRTLRFGGKDLLSIGVLALFRFGRSGLGELAQEGELWQLAAQAIGSQVPLDAGLPKPRAEFLAYGAAYAPAGETATLLPATVAVGAARKELYVFGDRYFNAFGQISAPQPFQRIPIEPARAYGGAGFAANPAGRGAAALPLEAGGTRQPLPNIETPTALIASSGDVRAPAGFWAWPASIPERERLLGAFDQRWLAAQWPHLPEGTQTEYFCSAPPDQRIEGFWRGDEPVTMHNMHPSTPRLQARLPGLRARCFVHRRVGETMHFEECAARAETVWLFPELEQGIVLYRAVAPVADEDADDVLHIVADWETLAATPLPIEAYRDRLLAQIAPAAAPVKPAIPAIQTPMAATPMAPPSAAVTAAAAAAPATASSELAEIEKTTAELEAQTQALLKQHGLTERDLAAATPAEEPEGAPPTLEAVARMTQEIESETAALLKRHNLTLQDIEKFTAQSQTAATAPLGAQLREVETQTRQMLVRSGTTPAQLGARAEDPELAAVLGERSIFDDATIAKLEALMQPEPSGAQAVGAGSAGIAQAGTAAAAGAVARATDSAAKAAGAAAAPIEAPAVAPRLTREEVLARAAAGDSLAGLDLSGLDLSAATLEGADFSGALLADTRFTGSRLARANLSRCLLRDADLSGADLHGARLDEASAGAARFTGTQLDGANLDAGDFAAADFSTASLVGARCVRANFEGAQMAQLRAANCQAEQANFGGCTLSGADFSEARLRAAQFDRTVLDGARFTRAGCETLRLFATRGAGVRFDQADLRGSRAGLDTDLSGADFTGAKLDTAAWLNIDLRDAIFDDSSLEGANFSGVQAAGASFVRVRAMSMRLSKADLSGADLRHANLFKASLRRTRLDSAQLQFSNLYGADCYGSSIGRARLDGANLERTLLAIPGRAEAKA